MTTKREELLAERERLQQRELAIYEEMKQGADSTRVDELLRERRANLRRQVELVDEIGALNLTTELKRDHQITVKCTGGGSGCGKLYTILARHEDVERWRKGELIQNAMPYLSNDQRELLMSQTCGECWRRFFGEEDDE